jgi:hypothetical protein
MLINLKSIKENFELLFQKEEEVITKVLQCQTNSEYVLLIYEVHQQVA